MQSHRVLFWAPRALCILMIAFVSVFALDVFQEVQGFWQTLAALAVHLIPTFVMVAALAVAWRWEWLGAVFFGGCGIFFAIIVRSPWWGKAIFAAPCFVTALLFLAGWKAKTGQSGRQGS
jgi:hypothetical protein